MGQQWAEAVRLLSEMPQCTCQPDVINYKTTIRALGKGQQWAASVRLLAEMQRLCPIRASPPPPRKLRRSLSLPRQELFECSREEPTERRLKAFIRMITEDLIQLDRRAFVAALRTYLNVQWVCRLLHRSVTICANAYY